MKHKVSLHYTGCDHLWHVTLNNEDVYSTKDEYKRDMFAAELKVRINLLEEDDGLAREKSKADLQKAE